MSSYKAEYKIKCWNDCDMAGCPSHTIRIEANNTSNALAYYKDGLVEFGMDFDELAEFIKHIYEMRYWVEVDKVFKGLEQGETHER